MSEVRPEHAHARAQEREAEREHGPEEVRRAGRLEERERAREAHRTAVGRVVCGDDREGELWVRVGRVGICGVRGRGRGEEGGGGAEAGGEAVFVEAVFCPCAGVGDAAGALDGGELALGADRLGVGGRRLVFEGRMGVSGGMTEPYLVAENGMVVLVAAKLERGFGLEWRVERDEDGAVRGHVEVLELVHPVCQVELEMGASVRGVRSGKMELTRSRTRMSG